MLSGELLIFAGQRTDGTNIDGVQRIRVVELMTRCHRQLLTITSPRHRKLFLTRDLITDTDATGTQNAPLRVEDNVRTEILHLRLVDLRDRRPRSGPAGP